MRSEVHVCLAQNNGCWSKIFFSNSIVSYLLQFVSLQTLRVLLWPAGAPGVNVMRATASNEPTRQATNSGGLSAKNAFALFIGASP